jgi:23S rRNA (guanosine2251-2'-O)-methyltransferase
MSRSHIYGRNPVAEALDGRRRVHRVWRVKDAGVVIPEGVPVSEVDRHALEGLCGSPEHQGIVAEVDPFPYSDAEALLHSEEALLIALDQVQDPQNLGAICRSAESAGVAGVVLPERRSADISPAVCKASAGAVEHLPVARVRNLADFLLRARELGAWVYGAASEGGDDYADVDYEGRTVLVLGGEGAGLRPRVRSACDRLVSIPLRGKTGSLNVSAAAAVLLFHAVRERNSGIPDSGNAGSSGGAKKPGNEGP